MDTNPTDSQGMTSPEPVLKTHGNRVLMGVLAYLGILIIIPYLAEKEDPFVKFHIKQGLVLFIGEVILWILSSMLWFVHPLWVILDIINFVIFVLAIIGIINVVQGKEKELPLVGHFAASFKI